MSADEIKAKAAKLAELYAAKAAGKTLQYDQFNWGWTDVHSLTSPDMRSILSLWRVKPEPRRMWEIHDGPQRTYDEDTAEAWRRAGFTVAEWKEVLP